MLKTLHFRPLQSTVMASSSSLVDSLEKELECSLCLDIYTNPKTLPCLHTFCCHCLDGLAGKSRENRQPIACPDCRTQIDLPHGTTFDVFPTAFYLNRLKDIVSVQRQEDQVPCGSCDKKSAVVAFCLNCKCFICVDCQDLHSTLKAWKGHRLAALNKIQDADVQEILRAPQICQEEFHDNAVLEYFCKTCQRCICQKCTTITHKNHDLEYLKEAAEKAKRRLLETESKVRERADVWEKQTNKDNDTRRKIKKQIEETRQAIQENSRRLMELLKQHEQQLLTEVDTFEEDLEKKCNDHIESSEVRRAQLNSITEYLRSVRLRAISEEILKAEQSAMNRTQEVLDAMANYHPLKIVYVEYKPDKDVSRRLDNSPLGRVYSGLADPQKTQVLELTKTRLEIERRAQFTVVTKDTEDNICYSASEHVSVQILSPAGDEVETEVEDRKDGTYTVCFTPITDGVHHVTVRVRCQSPANSPLEVHVTKRRPRGYKAMATFGSNGSGKGQFQLPRGVAVNRAGEVAVSDSENYRVQIFSVYGKYLREFGTKGTADGQFRSPAGVAYNKAGHIVVADNSRIQVFSSTGRWISKFGQDVLKRPYGVSVTSDDNIVVCDDRENTVNVFSPQGVLLLQFYPGSSPLSAVFCEEKYFVSVTSHVIKVFNSRGSPLYDIGQLGKGVGHFMFPWGLAVDTNDLLLVCDRNNDRFQVFTLQGKFVTSCGSGGSELGQLSSPCHIAVSPDGRAFVTDFSNHRVQVFEAQY